MKRKKMVLIALLAVVVMSCGGGGGGGGGGTSSPTPSIPSNPNNPGAGGNGNNSGGNNSGNNGNPNSPNNPNNPNNSANSFREGVVKVDRQRLRVPVNPDELSPKVSSWRTYYYLEFNEDNKIGIKVTPLDRGYIHRNGEPIKHDITMTGKRSIAVYAKENDVTGGGGKTVTIGEESVGIYLQAVKPTAIIRGNGWSSTNYSLITNQEFRYAGKVSINGNNSIGTYYGVERYDHSDIPADPNISTYGDYKNEGTIESKPGTVNVIGAYFKIDNGHMKTFRNAGTINMEGDKSIGMYGTGEGEYSIYNYEYVGGSKISVGASSDKRNPNIGMYTDSEKVSLHNGNSSHLQEKGTIEVGANSVGMYKVRGTGDGTPQVVNHSRGTILLKGDNAIGMILGENVYGVNEGSIIADTRDLFEEYYPKRVIGVVLGKNAIFENRGTIDISYSYGGIGILNGGGTVRNYGTINIYPGNSQPSKEEIVREKIVDPITAQILMNRIKVPMSLESPKLYVDTLGKTNPINGIASSRVEKVNLVMGAEAASETNSTEIKVDKKILSKYNASFKGGNIKEIDVKSDALTWEAEAETSGNEVKNVTLKKKSYTEFAEDEETKKLAAGLDERYVSNSADSKEKQLFNYINTLGNNQRKLLSKTYKEVSGNQYINVQQRIKETGTMLDREINDIQKEVTEGSKVKTFATKGKYSSKIDEVPDHEATGYGAVYAYNSKEKKLGWYAAAGVNNFKLKDSGRTDEEVSMLKLGVHKTFELGLGMDWKVTGEGFISRSEMERKYVVGGEQYTGQAGYNAYGGAIKNEIGKDINLTETFTLRPYVGLKAEYGKFNNIKEKNGVLRLEVKGNDYYSIRPEAGLEMSYIQPITDRARIRAILGIGYDYEVGKVENIENRIRFVGTGTDWYKLKGEKEGERGNFKGNVSLGFEKGHYSLTLTGGYETRGKNARVGLGFGASF